MNTEMALQTAGELLSPWAKNTENPEPNRLGARLEKTALLPAVKALLDAEWGYLAAITGLDLGIEVGDIEVLYHFCGGAAVLTLRVRIPRADGSVPSICSIIPSASFFERELSEMLGVMVTDIPDSDHLFLPDNSYPLRKDFVLQHTGTD